MTGQPVTEKQANYIAALQRGLSLPKLLLDNHCIQRFKRPFVQIDRAQASALIEEMLTWQQLPAEFQRAKGQLDLPGFG